MNTKPQLTEDQQKASIRLAVDLLTSSRSGEAHATLLETIESTPTESKWYPVLVGAANWLSPLTLPQAAIACLLRSAVTETEEGAA